MLESHSAVLVLPLVEQHPVIAKNHSAGAWLWVCSLRQVRLVQV